MLTRKQLWRQTISFKYKKFIDENNDYNNCIPKIKNNKKKVKFNNIVRATLIPTKEELNRIYNYYNAHLEFE